MKRHAGSADIATPSPKEQDDRSYTDWAFYSTAFIVENMSVNVYLVLTSLKISVQVLYKDLPRGRWLQSFTTKSCSTTTLLETCPYNHSKQEQLIDIIRHIQRPSKWCRFPSEKYTENICGNWLAWENTCWNKLWWHAHSETWYSNYT